MAGLSSKNIKQHRRTGNLSAPPRSPQMRIYLWSLIIRTSSVIDANSLAMSNVSWMEGIHFVYLIFWTSLFKFNKRFTLAKGHAHLCYKVFTLDQFCEEANLQYINQGRGGEMLTQRILKQDRNWLKYFVHLEAFWGRRQVALPSVFINILWLSYKPSPPPLDVKANLKSSWANGRGLSFQPGQFQLVLNKHLSRRSTT
jgi:hypothetical protein